MKIDHSKGIKSANGTYSALEIDNFEVKCDTDDFCVDLKKDQLDNALNAYVTIWNSPQMMCLGLDPQRLTLEFKNNKLNAKFGLKKAQTSSFRMDAYCDSEAVQMRFDPRY